MTEPFSVHHIADAKNFLERNAGQDFLDILRLEFFTKTGLSFVSQSGGTIKGIIFAQPVWQGDRTIVLCSGIFGDQAGLAEQVENAARQIEAASIVMIGGGANLQILQELGFDAEPTTLSSKNLNPNWRNKA